MVYTSPSLPRSAGEEVGRAGGAQRHGTAVPSGARGGAGRLEGGRGGPPGGGFPPDPPRMDRPLRARRPVLACRPVPPAKQLPTSDGRRGRSGDLRAPQGAPWVGAPPDRAPAGSRRGGAGPVPLVDLPMPAPPRPHRAPPPAQTPRRVPPVGA